MATRNNAEEDCCTMQLLFFINSKLNWIERIAIVLSGALTARHFFIIVKYTHLCWHRCLVSTSSLSPSLDWTMHMYIVHAHLHTWHLNSKGDKNMNRPCNQSVHNNRIETKCTTCIMKRGKKQKEKRQENRDKEEPQTQNRAHTLTQSDWNQMCRLFANTSFNRLTPITISRFRSGTFVFFCLPFLLLIKIRDLCHSQNNFVCQRWMWY